MNVDNLAIPDFKKQKKDNLDRIVKLFEKKNQKIEHPLYSEYNPNSVAFEKVKSVSKRDPKFKKIIIKENHPTYITDDRGRKVHKSNLRKFTKNS